MTWNGWRPAQPELDELFIEFDSDPEPPVIDGFEHVADAAVESSIPILRHVRHVAYQRGGTTHPRRDRRSEQRAAIATAAPDEDIPKGTDAHHFSLTDRSAA